MADSWRNDDEFLLAELGAAQRAADAVPRSVVEAAKATYSWYTIDAELAALVEDSAADALAGVSTSRSASGAEPAAVRTLAFSARHLTIELELSTEGFTGQLVPPQRGEIEIHIEGQPVLHSSIDEFGYFRIRHDLAAPGDRPPPPAGSTAPAPWNAAFRLSCRTEAGVHVLSDRIAF
jgi:hypothetical protein